MLRVPVLEFTVTHDGAVVAPQLLILNVIVEVPELDQLRSGVTERLFPSITEYDWGSTWKKMSVVDVVPVMYETGLLIYDEVAGVNEASREPIVTPLSETMSSVPVERAVIVNTPAENSAMMSIESTVNFAI